MERWQKPEAESAQAGRPLNHHPPTRSSLDYNTPLRSVRGDATSTPSPFYKLSAELSRESLRIPGAVPFIWEQSPGRRKFSAASPPPPIFTPHSAIPKPQASSFLPESPITRAVDSAKPNLATLFRQPSLKGVVVADTPAAANSRPDAPISPVIPQILPPPAADHPRSSSARYSVMQRIMPPSASFNNAPLQIDNNDDDDDDAVSEESISDAVTATAGEGLSVDDSLVLSGALRPASTPSEARDFIMHRFLPAAHTIACESPQTPSRRFLPPVGVGGMAPCSPTMAGSFRDCTAACRPSPLRYASASSTPASNARQVPPRGQLHAGSFGGEAEEEEEEEEDEEEEPPFTPKSCGIFPFRITISFHNRHTTGECSRRNPSSKHQNNKQQQQKKGFKSINCAGSPMRIMDILRDDHSSSHDDESPVHRPRSRHSEAERERIKAAVLEQAGLMQVSSKRRPKPPSNSYYRESPNLHQLLTAQNAASELSYNEESSEYGSYQEAPSRFQSPSPAAFHMNARALRAHNVQSPLGDSIAQRTRSFAGFQDDQTSAAIISTTEQHLLNSSFYYYNMHSSINKPHIYQPQQLASPSTYHTPLSSHVGAPHQNCAYHDNLSNNTENSVSSLENANYHDTITTNAEQWDAASSPHLPQKTHIINNALFEHEDQETYMIANTKWTALTQAGQGGRHGESNINCADPEHYVSRGDHHMINGDLRRGNAGDHHVNNGNHYLSNGHHYVSHNSHYASKDDPHPVINGDNHVINANKHLSNGDMYVSTNGDVHSNVNPSLPSKSLLTPPLPKSPTHSWLDRAMPLVASSNKRLSTSSRLSHMHKATLPANDYADPVSMSKTRKQGSTEASKWEALVKGSHLQPGHLRFSEELFHQSQSFMKVGAS